MTAAVFAYACVAIAALLLMLDRHIQNSSPSADTPSADGEDTYWLTAEGYAALANYDDQERRA